MGDAADDALDYMSSLDEWELKQENLVGNEWGVFRPRPKDPKKRKDRKRPQSSMRECGLCGKYPLFFYEEQPHVWILAEWSDEHRPIRHVCKLRKKFNHARTL